MTNPDNADTSRFPDYESFSVEGKEWPPYNNFGAFFYEKPDHFLYPFYRDSEPGTIMRTEHPDIDAALAKIVTRLMDEDRGATDPEWKAEVEPLLFVAYRMLEAHAEMRTLLDENPDRLTQ